MPKENFSGVRKLFEQHENIPYVILKNWEILGTGDVEVLVLNRDEFVNVFQIGETKTGFYKTFGLKKVVFKVRTLKDNFFFPTLADRVLKGRVKDVETNLYVPHPNDRFISYLYHALYHHESMTADDQVRLSKTMPKDYKAPLSDKVYAHQYLCNLGYFPLRAEDKSVGYWLP